MAYCFIILELLIFSTGFSGRTCSSYEHIYSNSLFLRVHILRE